MNRSPTSVMFRRRAAELRARLLRVLERQAGQPDAFAAVLRRDYGVRDAHLIEDLRQRARRGDLSWYPRLRFASDGELHGRTTRVVGGAVWVSDAYVHADREAASLFCQAARACFPPSVPRIVRALIRAAGIVRRAVVVGRVHLHRLLRPGKLA